MSTEKISDYRVFSTLTDSYRGVESYLNIQEVYGLGRDTIEVTQKSIKYNCGTTWYLADMEFMHAIARRNAKLEDLGILAQSLLDAKISPENFDLLAAYHFLFSDDAAMCHGEFLSDVRKIITRAQKALGLRGATNRAAEIGYVYLIRSSEGECKIGLSKTPKKRIRKLGVVLPFDVEVKHLIKTNHMYLLESDLHTAFHDKRVRGEWFNLWMDDYLWLKDHNVIEYPEYPV